MRDLACRRPVLLVCAILLLLCAAAPSAAQPAAHQLFLPALSRPQQSRIAYFGAGNGSAAVLGVVDLSDGSRSEARFTINSPAYNLNYAWSPAAASLAFSEFTCSPGGRLTPCYPVSLVIARADGTLTRLSGTYEFLTWSPDGSRLAFAGNRSLQLVNADGGGQTTIVSSTAGIMLPSWSPDGQQIAYIDTQGDATLSLVPAAGGAPRPLLGNMLRYLWAPTGDLLATEGYSGAIHLIDTTTGAITPVSANRTLSAWSADGEWLSFSDRSSLLPFVVRRDGSGLRGIGEPSSLAWSPDGAKLALMFDTLEVLDLASNTRQRLAASGRIEGWSPDGSRIVLYDEASNYRLRVVPVDGGAPASVENIAYFGGLRWSPDSAWFSALNRVETPDNIVGARLLAISRSGKPLVEVIPGPYDFRLETFAWLPAQ